MIPKSGNSLSFLAQMKKILEVSKTEKYVISALKPSSEHLVTSARFPGRAVSTTTITMQTLHTLKIVGTISLGLLTVPQPQFPN
jgi:hypothetical protein